MKKRTLLHFVRALVLLKSACVVDPLVDFALSALKGAMQCNHHKVVAVNAVFRGEAIKRVYCRLLNFLLPDLPMLRQFLVQAAVMRASLILTEATYSEQYVSCSVWDFLTPALLKFFLLSCHEVCASFLFPLPLFRNMLPCSHTWN